MQNTVLILGARGRFGLTAARAFADAGWRVVGQMRPGDTAPAEATHDARIHWLGVHLNHTDAMVAGAQGATVVVHAINPAYTNQVWRTRVLPMLDAAIAITRRLDATLMLPGNIYNFGEDMPALLSEDTPQQARSVKGQVRIAMEAALERSGVRSVVIRAGNFFGGGRGTLFDSVMVKDIQKGRFTDAGLLHTPTAWAYLPDLARTFVAVARHRAQLKRFEVFHFAGYSLAGQQWLEALEPLARSQGWVKPGAKLKYSTLPWGIIRIGAWFNPTWASLVEMRYLCITPHALANDKLVAFMGPEPHTALALALKTALADLGLFQKSLPNSPPAGLARGV